jgi:hypothetical protein
VSNRFTQEDTPEYRVIRCELAPPDLNPQTPKPPLTLGQTEERIRGHPLTDERIRGQPSAGSVVVDRSPPGRPSGLVGGNVPDITATPAAVHPIVSADPPVVLPLGIPSPKSIPVNTGAEKLSVVVFANKGDSEVRECLLHCQSVPLYDTRFKCELHCFDVIACKVSQVLTD